MASVGLPSILVWQGLQSRANTLPMLMQEALQDGSALAMQRVSACLHQLAALACFVQCTRLSLYCRECSKLLQLYVAEQARHPVLAPLLLCAAVRVGQSLKSPLMCLIDSANLNELRLARGASSIDQTTSVHSAAWAVPTLKGLLCKQLKRTHYTLGQPSTNSEYAMAALQPNSFARLNNVASLWLGEMFLKSINDTKNYQQTCVQILRLELCCDRGSDAALPTTFFNMKKLFLELSTLKLMRVLRKRVRSLTQQAEQHGRVDIDRSLLIFHQVNACCEYLCPLAVQAMQKTSVSAQQLALHLRCWTETESEAQLLLCFCVLALERQLDLAIAMLQVRRSCERTDRRLPRKIQHFIRTHRRRLRTIYAVPLNCDRACAVTELVEIHQEFRQSFIGYRQARALVSVEDGVFHALVRCKAIALYVGEMALYELLWSLRELYVLVIERKLLLTKFLVSLLPRLSAYCLRSVKLGRREIGYDTRLISALTDEFRLHRQELILKTVLRDKKINLPTLNGHGTERKKRSISTAQLPSFLAKNIRGLMEDPVAIYRCQSTQEFSSFSRITILELTFLARGARALQVDRVAALSEVLLEIYRSLSALTALPEHKVLQQNLQGAHRCLRLSLNQAAARQNVCDVRPTIVGLYHFLERLHQAPADSPDSIQAALGAVNSLAADMRVFADVFANALSQGPGAGDGLAQEQLQGLMSATRRLQEELTGNGMISVARWREPLICAVGRHSNERGKPARLELFLDAIEAPRDLVRRLQPLLERLLCLMIDHSVEGAAQRRAAGKPDGARLSMRATRVDAVLVLSLDDDGVGMSLPQLAHEKDEIAALGGSLLLRSEASSASLVTVRIPCASVRWDIASKSL